MPFTCLALAAISGDGNGHKVIGLMSPTFKPASRASFTALRAIRADAPNATTMMSAFAFSDIASRSTAGSALNRHRTETEPAPVNDEPSSLSFSTAEAIAQSALDLGAVDPYRAGVFFGNGMGGYPDTDRAVKDIVRKGGNRIDPFYMVKMLPNMAAAQVAMRYGTKGYNATISTACASAGNAMGEAMDLIRNGRADVMIAGGTEAGLSELGLAAFQVMKAISTSNDPPEKASRPFDAKRDGFVSSEGAGVFIIEALEHAQARGARILAELAGYGCTSDAHHVVVPVEDGETTAAAMTLALQDAGVRPEDIDYINAHGTSTQMNDKYETVALKRALGEMAYQIPMSSTKSLIGHTLGASAAIEAVACVQSILTGIVHPTINQEYPDPDCDLDYIPNKARKVDVNVVLKNSFGFGGQNACLVFKRFEP